MSQEALVKRHVEYMLPFAEDQEFGEDYEVTLCATRTRYRKELQEIVDSLSPLRLLRMGGAGSKARAVLLE